MIIFPAIDLYEGQAVRLYKGDYAQKTVYSDNPVSVAKDFAAAGATHVHLVDLEGAKNGDTPNFDLVCKIKSESGLFCEIGGGIRTYETVKKYIDAGIDRVILGTAAIEDTKLLCRLVESFGDKIGVGVDIRDGYVAIKGWTETTSVNVYDFVEKIEKIGVDAIICTDISKDGAMLGTNRELYRELSAKFDIKITASGGVSTIDDVRALRELDIYGAIIGKAYYTGAISLPEAIKAVE